jgi:hypothetical protein
MLMAACGASEDTTYLTPIPQSTLSAYREVYPIETQLEAVIAARAHLGASRAQFVEEPKVLLVEQMTLAEADKRIAPSGPSVIQPSQGETPVWLIIFEGDWQVFPPDPSHTVTPPPPRHGCSYVVVGVTESHYAEVDRPSCPP